MNVRYANLSPGSYSLTYRASNSDGKWGNAQVLRIFIGAPFWNKGWFYLTMAMTLTGSVILITRRIAQQKLKQQVMELQQRYQIENERHRIGRDMHDDIGAGLTQITLMSEAGKRNNTPFKQLDEIGNASRQLVASISEIIWSMNAENNSPDHLLSYMREQLHRLLEHSGIKYTIDFPSYPGDCQLTNEQRRNMLLATKEVVHNAVKHSKASFILVKATIENCKLEILVEDDGIGFNTSRVFSGSGLHNFENRMKQMDAELSVCSEVNKGSTFKFGLLLNSHS
jgi:signal transduction histidine kinase